MHHKNILLISATARLHDRMRELSHAIDVSIALANESTFSQAISSGHEFDLVILDSEGISQETLNAVDSFVADNGFIPMLLVQDAEKLSSLHMPTQGKNDFIVSAATVSEFEMRCTLLLWPGEESAPADRHGARFCAIVRLTKNKFRNYAPSQESLAIILVSDVGCPLDHGVDHMF